LKVELDNPKAQCDDNTAQEALLQPLVHIMGSTMRPTLKNYLSTEIDAIGVQKKKWTLICLGQYMQIKIREDH
jgi:hypothetical protein